MTAPLGVEQARWTSALVAGTSGRTRSPARRAVVPRAASTRNTPAWAGETPLSSVLNAAIRTPWIFSVMRFGAKKIMKDDAEKRGVPWKATLENYKNNPEVLEIFEEIKDPSLEYPSYYTKPFHGYEEGNLNWEAAFEAESATYMIGWRTFKDENMTAMDGHIKLRSQIMNVVTDYRGEAPMKDILDVGCSVGCSTRFLTQHFPEAKVTGLDLSPYFLAVAEHSRRTSANKDEAERINYVMSLAEDTGMPDESFDFVSTQFVLHECPSTASVDILTESFRLLRPGGVVAVVENDPTSEVIQNLPPILFILMKSTEPWSDDCYTFDFEAAISKIGYEDVKTIRSDARHRVILGRKPL